VYLNAPRPKLSISRNKIPKFSGEGLRPYLCGKGTLSTQSGLWGGSVLLPTEVGEGTLEELNHERGSAQCCI